MTLESPSARDDAAKLKSNILAAVRAEPAATRRDTIRRSALLLTLAVVASLATFAYFGGVRLHGRPQLLVVATFVGWLAMGFAAIVIAFARGRSMLGRPTRWLLALTVAAPIVLLVWKVAVTLPFGEEHLARWEHHPGLRCLGLLLVMALPLLAAFTLARRRTDPVRPGIAGAALGMTAGVVAGGLVDLWCPSAYVPHLLLGHIAPLALLIALGSVAGRRFLRT